MSIQLQFLIKMIIITQAVILTQGIRCFTCTDCVVNPLNQTTCHFAMEGCMTVAFYNDQGGRTINKMCSIGKRDPGCQTHGKVSSCFCNTNFCNGRDVVMPKPRNTEPPPHTTTTKGTTTVLTSMLFILVFLVGQTTHVLYG